MKLKLSIMCQIVNVPNLWLLYLIWKLFNVSIKLLWYNFQRCANAFDAQSLKQILAIMIIAEVSCVWFQRLLRLILVLAFLACASQSSIKNNEFSFALEQNDSENVFPHSVAFVSVTKENCAESFLDFSYNLLKASRDSLSVLLETLQKSLAETKIAFNLIFATREQKEQEWNCVGEKLCLRMREIEL